MTTRPSMFVFSREYPPVTVGGTSTVARNLAVGLTRHGWSVTVLTTAPDRDGDLRQVLEGVLVHRLGTETIYQSTTGLDDGAIRSHRRMYAAAEQLAAEVGAPQAVALPDLFCNPEAAMFSRRHGVPLINVLLQDFRAIVPYDRDEHRVTSGVAAQRNHLLALEERTFRTSDHTVFISQALSDAVTGHYPDIDAPHSVVHLGVDLAECAAVEADTTWQRERTRLLDSTGDQQLLVACGRLVPVKGFAPLLVALHRLVTASRPRCRPHLALVGVGPEEPHLRRLAAELRITDHVSFLGDVPRRTALGWMSVADVAVVPSLWESFCYVCAEMMALRRPVVCTAVDSLRELVPSEEVGYPVAVSGGPGERVLLPDDLADAIERALAHPEEARRRGQAAHRRIVEHFGNDNFARGIAELAEQLTMTRNRD
ncbi:glycosyltransferase family 4 protein [Micromonospora echinospora]